MKNGIEEAQKYSECGYNNIKTIIEAITELDGNYIEFDCTLVRGLGYYTSTVFEAVCDNFNGSIAGGGRYDEMISELSGVSSPACGFAIGFERLCDLLEESKFVPNYDKRIALLYDLTDMSVKDVIKIADGYRKESICSIFEKKKKLSKQLDRIKEQGFNYFVFANDPTELREFE